MRRVAIGTLLLVLLSCQGGLDLPASDGLSSGGNKGGLQGSCASDGDCQNDSYCDKGQCVSYGSAGKTHDMACGRSTALFTPEEFAAPAVKCSWTNGMVEDPPVVADLDGDGQPELVFVAVYAGSHDGNLVAIRGDTCATVFDVSGDAATLGITDDSLSLGDEPAVADLDGDKRPEIIVTTWLSRVVVFGSTGQVLAVSGVRAAGNGCYSPSVINLDGQGAPEIVCGGMALRFENGSLTTLYNVSLQSDMFSGGSAIVEDVDLDGTPELLTGNRIADGLTGTDKTPAPVKSWAGGSVAIAQWDESTPEPEIIFVSWQLDAPGTLRVYHPRTGNVVFGPYTFGDKSGAAYTVADFDDDGEPEISAGANNTIAVFDQQCATTPLPSFCHSPGIRWRRDDAGGTWGLSAFDFNGDGAAEVVYRDGCWLRGLDGKSGQARFASSIGKVGRHSAMPVIADVDNDGHADIVVPIGSRAASYVADSQCQAEAELNLPWSAGHDTEGVIVLEDARDRWMSSRPIWNQSSYHITNINDDATIPLREEHNWLTWNNYRQNVQGSGGGGAAAPDLTASKAESSSSCSSGELVASICNRGAAEAPAGIPNTFYAGDPRSSGKAICTAQMTNGLAAGQCETVRCKYASPSRGEIELWFRADDDGKGKGKTTECKEQNNLLHLPALTCHSVD